VPFLSRHNRLLLVSDHLEISSKNFKLTITFQPYCIEDTIRSCRCQMSQPWQPWCCRSSPCATLQTGNHYSKLLLPKFLTLSRNDRLLLVSADHLEHTFRHKTKQHNLSNLAAKRARFGVVDARCRNLGHLGAVIAVLVPFLSRHNRLLFVSADHLKHTFRHTTKQQPFQPCCKEGTIQSC
jgi:hypothetical protein